MMQTNALLATALLTLATSSACADTLGALTKKVLFGQPNATGYLGSTSPEAKLVSSVTRSNLPVSATVETVTQLERGCKRIRVSLAQGAYHFPPMEMNVCPDGSAPERSIDIEAAARQFNPAQSIQ